MDTNNKSFEPMDIDSSSHSNQPMDISYNNSGIDLNIKVKSENVDQIIQSPPAEYLMTSAAPAASTPQPTAIKKYHILLPKENKNTPNNITIKIVCSVVVLLFAIISHQFCNIQCSDDLNIESLRSSLSNSLFGQYRAIELIVEGLRVKDTSKILFFYGGTGVGKTYTTSFILNEVGYHSNVYHYTMPSFIDTFSTEFMVGLTFCQQSLVIVDDLILEHDIFSQIRDLITKSTDLDKNITIILVYSCKTSDGLNQCDNTFPTQLLKQFDKLNIFKKLIKFETLQQQHLQKCIEYELQREITDIEFLKFIRTFNVTIDGCKGVHHKVKHLDVY